MESIRTPRFILSANRTGAGKSLIAIGLAVALRKRNLGLSCAVLGTHPLQSIVLKRLVRRYVRCIDLNILSNSEALGGLQQASVGADLVMIEGQDGLFDGASPGSFKASDAEFAALSRSPVVLIADARGYNNSIAALIKGYSEFAQGFSIAGCIANRCEARAEDPRDKIYYDCALQAFGMQPLVGAVPESPRGWPELSGKFSQQQGSPGMPLQFFKDVGSLAEQHIDLEEVVRIASAADELILPFDSPLPENRRTRIAVSDDSCFNICFQDNVDLMRAFGAEIATFSPVADEELPKRIGAVYLTGAQLFEYGSEVSKNESMKNSIRRFVENGGVVYSEGAGTAYLCEEFEGDDEGNLYPGVGVIKGTAVRDNSHFSYTEMITIEDSVLGRAGLAFKGASIGEWKLKSSRLFSKALRISTGTISTYDEGYSPGAQIVATFTFPHYGSNPLVIKNLVDAAEIVARV